MTPVRRSAYPAGTAAAARRGPQPLVVRRMLPLVATAGLIAIGMASTIWWGPAIAAKTAWSLPYDLWGTLVGAQRLAHLNLAGLYRPPTGLVGFPGAALILVPAAAIIEAAGISLAVPGPHRAQPEAWLIAGPYEIAACAVVLFAADAAAERLGVSRPRRALLAAAGAVALWSVSVRWGHPEDAVAVGLLLYGVLALSRSRHGRSAWLLGAAAAVQPLVLLALPVVVTAIEPRRLAGYLTRAAAPAVALLAAAAAANWTATVPAVTRQPNWPAVDHPTPWLFLAPHLRHGAVAAGPARMLAILAACGCAAVASRGWRPLPRRGDWPRPALRRFLWWIAVALALRSVFEPVMVAYYLWPPLAIALVAATRNWARLAATSVGAAAITFASQLPWRSAWGWWAPMVAGLGLTLWLARVPVTAEPAAPAVSPGGISPGGISPGPG